MFTTSMPAALHNRPPLNHPPNPVIPGLTRNPFLPLPLLPPFTIAPRPNHPPNVVIPPPPVIPDSIRNPCSTSPSSFQSPPPTRATSNPNTLSFRARPGIHFYPFHPDCPFQSPPPNHPLCHSRPPIVIPGLTRNPFLSLPSPPPSAILPAANFARIVIPGLTRNPFLPRPCPPPFTIAPRPNHPPNVVIPAPPCHSGLDPESIFAPSIVTALYAYPRRCTHQTVSFLRKQESIFAPSNHSAFSEI